jgi:fructokinase
MAHQREIAHLKELGHLKETDVHTLVIGETLIDAVRRPDGSQQEHVGGSPANVAVGLARLGHDVRLATMIGNDERGTRIAAFLHDERVGLTPGSIHSRPTSVARSNLDAAGAATYDFDLTWDVAEVQPVDDVAHVHTGSIAATLEPGATTVLSIVQNARPSATISYDPNTRPSLMGDPYEVRAKVEQLVGLADVVKASEEDVAWLYGAAPLLQIVSLWQLLGPALLVVTRGDQGALIALADTGQASSVAAPAVEVVDTVGAGDSFMAGLLSGLLEAGLLGGAEGRVRLRSASLTEVRPAVDRALACARVTVSRAGADPPYRIDLQPHGPAGE